MTLNQQLLKELRERAAAMGVVLALPQHINRDTPQDQNHVVYLAGAYLNILERGG